MVNVVCDVTSQILNLKNFSVISHLKEAGKASTTCLSFYKNGQIEFRVEAEGFSTDIIDKGLNLIGQDRYQNGKNVLDETSFFEDVRQRLMQSFSAL